VTPEQEALVAVTRTLEHLRIPHMVTGSVASSFHGRPRSTHDADIVIDPSPEQLDGLLHRLDAAGYYVDAARARDAFGRRLQFNVIETHSAFKIDLIRRPRSLAGNHRRGAVSSARAQRAVRLSMEPLCFATAAAVCS
jgi:hypothetical protein